MKQRATIKPEQLTTEVHGPEQKPGTGTRVNAVYEL